MQTVYDKQRIHTSLTDGDRELLHRLVAVFGPFVEVEPIGRYYTMDLNDVWLMLVDQVCVMGSARHLERLHSNTTTRAEFERAVSFHSVSSQQNPVSYLAEVLRSFSATRFPQKSAERLVSVLRSPSVFRGGSSVLFEGLSHKDNAIQTRDRLIKRCPVFRLKGASDFMISAGLSHDVIALDTRVVGILHKYFDYNLTARRIQSHRGRYLSLEAALREFCRERGVSLALLDRLLFRFGNLGAIELLVKYPEVVCRQR